MLIEISLQAHSLSHRSNTTGIPEREMQKLREEAEAHNKPSFAFAFYMDRQKEERERGKQNVSVES
jgi:translation elongation factor EF-1alpha